MPKLITKYSTFTIYFTERMGYYAYNEDLGDILFRAPTLKELYDKMGNKVKYTQNTVKEEPRKIDTNHYFNGKLYPVGD